MQDLREALDHLEPLVPLDSVSVEVLEPPVYRVYLGHLEQLGFKEQPERSVFLDSQALVDRLDNQVLQVQLDFRDQLEQQVSTLVFK